MQESTDDEKVFDTLFCCEECSYQWSQEGEQMDIACKCPGCGKLEYGYGVQERLDLKEKEKQP